MIKNPTPEEIQAMMKKNSNVILEEEKQEIVEEKSVTALDELKPKKSRFEPDPKAFELPSNKFFINSGKIYIRRMNTEEEAKLTAIKDGESFNVIMDSILETAIKSNISIKKLAMCDKVPLFVFLLSISYSKQLKVKLDCSQSCEKTILFSDLKIDKVSEDLQYPFSDSIKIEGEDWKFSYRYPSVGDATKNETEISDMIKDVIVSIESSQGPLGKNEWKEFVNWLPLESKRVISENLDIFSKKGTYYLYKTNCKTMGCDFSGKISLDEVLIKLMEEMKTGE